MKAVNTPDFYLYSFLSNVRPLKASYTAKIMAVAFCGTHIPLLALLLSFVFSQSYSSEIAIRVLVIALSSTLGGTAITLYALNLLLAPVKATSNALRDYNKSQKLPELPMHFEDAAGTLMADTTLTIKQLDELIDYIANYDDVTRLPTRGLFCNRLKLQISESQSHQKMTAFFVIRIDDFANLSRSMDFKLVNEILQVIAQRLSSSILATDLIGYLNTGEFIIAQVDFPVLEMVISLVRTLLDAVAKTVYVSGKPVHLTASIGITIASSSSFLKPHGVDEILQQAQAGLYQARMKGRGQYQFYSPEINAKLEADLMLEQALHQALLKEQLQVYYQPLVDLKTGQITAMEALVRWHHPSFGMISPARFIPIAEANGLILEIGEWVLRTACAQNRCWQCSGLPHIRVSVNLSARQFEKANLVGFVRQTLFETDLSPEYLELEVTESFLMADVNMSIQTLRELGDLGVELALDDFGTGYSSLSYLKGFPVNMLKIDQSFLTDVTVQVDSAAIAEAIISLARVLNLTTTAEGIETADQLAFLQQHGCTEGQGFYFARPQPVEDATRILAGGFADLVLS